jgi:hypothetical protein
MEDSMREILRMISDMERDSKDIQMEILITVTLKWERLMAREYIHGAMGKFMMVNGIKD